MDYEKKKNFIVSFLYGAIVLFIIFVVIQYGLSLITPFIFAFIIAYIIRKPSRFIAAKLKIPYKPISMILVLLFYGTIGVLIALLSIKLVSSATDFISMLPHLYQSQFEPYLTSVFGEIEQAVFRMDPSIISALNDFFEQFTRSLGESISGLSMKIISTASGYASSLPGLLIKTLLMIISSFFIVGDYDKLRDFVLRQFSGKAGTLMIHIKEYIVGTLFVCIRSYALIMSITFVELSLGLSIIGIANPIPIALAISVFDVLPVLGTGGVMIPWTIIAALQGNYPLAIGLLIIYLAITIIRNIIEPKIVGKQIGLHPVVTLISMFVGAQLFGVIGLFGFPITLSLLRHLNDTGTIRLFR